ncbi:MAG TPA: hypothetical protein VGK21_09385 [Candidatus Angelobacter sp.]
MDSRIREDIVDRGIERGEWEMRNLSKQLGYEDAGQPRSMEPHVGAVGAHNSGQMSANDADQIGTAPIASSKDEGSTRHDIDKDDIRDRKVDPEAVRESFKEAELDPAAENEPEEGEDAA